MTEHNKKPKPLLLSDLEWQQKLSPEAYRVCRQKGTERPFSGEFDLHFEPGVYTCHCCGSELFMSDSKFNAGCGWPSFDAQIAAGQLAEIKDMSHGMVRTEVVCQHCDAHLGHVFDDGPTATGLRYCINSIALDFNGS